MAAHTTSVCVERVGTMVQQARTPEFGYYFTTARNVSWDNFKQF